MRIYNFTEEQMLTNQMDEQMSIHSLVLIHSLIHSIWFVSIPFVSIPFHVLSYIKHHTMYMPNVICHVIFPLSLSLFQVIHIDFFIFRVVNWEMIKWEVLKSYFINLLSIQLFVCLQIKWINEVLWDFICFTIYISNQSKMVATKSRKNSKWEIW